MILKILKLNYFYNFFYKSILVNILFFNILLSKEEFDFGNINFSENFPNLIFGVAPKNNFDDNFPDSKFMASYVFTVKMPQSIVKNFPKISGYYKGEKLNFDNNFCTICEDLKTGSFTIIVTPDFTRKAEDKNIYCLERKENLPCKIFYVNRLEKPSKNNSGDYDIEWHIEREFNCENMSKKLPDNSVVILLDPEYVDDLKVIENQKNIEINGKAVIIKLPVLVLKLKDNNINSFKESFDNALIAAIDQKPFHRSTEESVVSRLEASTIISIKTRG